MPTKTTKPNRKTKLIGRSRSILKPSSPPISLSEGPHFRITSQPDLYPLKLSWANWSDPNWVRTGKIVLTAFIEYTDHRRNDRTETKTIKTDEFKASITFTEMLGGQLKVHMSFPIRHVRTGATTNVTGDYLYRIGGDNPSKSNIKGELGSITLQVIAYKESRFRQFASDYYPLFGPPNGFGIMQIDNPPPTAKQIWNWKENVKAGKKLLKTKEKEIKAIYKRIASDNGAPNLSTGQLKYALYQYYNGGLYWGWDRTSMNWVRNDTNGYGDDAVELEERVTAGNPPNDWN